MDDWDCPFEPILTDTAWVTFRILQSTSGTISVLSSLLIIFMIFWGGNQQIAKVHNRLLVVISLVNVAYSAALIAGSMPIPKDSVCVRGAMGNKITCTIQGYIVILGISVPSAYTATLCAYYVAVIRYNAHERTLKKFEPLMHFLSLMPGLFFSTFLLIKDWFGSSVSYCGLELSNDCKLDPNPACNMRHWFFKVFVLYLLILFGIVISSMTCIYCTVRERQSTMIRYNFGSLRDARGRERSSIRRLSNRVSETATQALLFVVAFLLSILPIVCAVYFKAKGRLNPFVLFLLAIFQPLQGLWILIIFLRPKYLHARSRMTEESIFKVFTTVIFTTPDELNRQHLRRRLERRATNVRASSQRMQNDGIVAPKIDNIGDLVNGDEVVPTDCCDRILKQEIYQPSESVSPLMLSNDDLSPMSRTKSKMYLVQQPLWEGREVDDEPSSIDDSVLYKHVTQQSHGIEKSRRRGSFLSFQRHDDSTISEILAGDGALPSRSQRRNSLPQDYFSQEWSDFGFLNPTAYDLDESSSIHSEPPSSIDVSNDEAFNVDPKSETPQKNHRRLSLPSLSVRETSTKLDIFLA